MGGLGKTTLAQLVYNHETVNQYFDFKCWMYVSEKFQVKEIIKGIIESIDEKECKLTHLDVLQKSLQDRLRGKKFLVVLDDVWIENDEKAKWDELSKTLSCGAEESIVMMTTRSKTTSQMMAMVRELQHELGCLSEDDSWLLFKKFAFAGREVDDISELEHIGKEIVAKCKRLPLAVKTIGSLMWSKRSTRDWEHVKDNILWNLQEHNVLPALKLSYDNLLPHLRRCYAYCCLFPKGYHMIKDEVIWLWVSNGFIPRKGEISLYVLGEEVFNCLVWRSFFQVEKADGFMDGIDRYKMHDLMYDMAQYVMRHDCLVIGSAYEEIKIPDELLHLGSPYENFSCEELRKLRSLRSIFVFGKVENASSITQISNHMYLRVLYLRNTWLRTLPESICKLKHLRYLNLSDSDIKVLPESIIFLQNLQVLILCSCTQLRKLPEGLIYMRNLQRLDINYCNSLGHLPCGISELTSLRMLSQFLVCKESGAKIEELRGLNLLEGMLEISGLENVGGLTEAKGVDLKCITNLSVLKLSWSYMVGEPERLKYDEEVLEGLEPNPYLKGLIIFQYMGKIISPSWMVSLRNLVEITFHWCKNCERIPPLGGLPNLRVLHLVRMFSLKYFHDEDTNMFEDITNRFLSLQELHIVHCENLVSLPCSLPKLEVLKMDKCWGLISLPADLPSITKLHLVACDRLRSLPDEILKDLNELVIDSKLLSKRCEKETGEDWPKISHIPNIKISSTW